ncbi:hypothetical protein FH972_026310 [Carpinus fangiana]|uniref:Uncharacterized protein n=1 Tax=Carpinus fangiana TaxID=176857 RepID=A0A5N6L3R5_9ROSI|nr:hypothetical protein FH972_026310 [Carpinus fangiana]
MPRRKSTMILSVMIKDRRVERRPVPNLRVSLAAKLRNAIIPTSPWRKSLFPQEKDLNVITLQLRSAGLALGRIKWRISVAMSCNSVRASVICVRIGRRIAAMAQ